MEFFITWSLALGLLVVPGLVNYYVNRYYTPPGTSMASTLELVVASLTLTFVVLVMAILTTLCVAQVWDELEQEISAFTGSGLLSYAQNRTSAFPGVMSAIVLGEIALLTLLGALRLPSRWVR